MEKKTIGAFIAALRKASGMTQQELADKLNVSNKAVSRWERDECAPDISLIPAIAEIFDVTCDELLKGERIFTAPAEQPKPEPKVEKQIRAMVSRTLGNYKIMCCISIAVALIGYILMLGISYGFYDLVIGFAVMLVFEIAAMFLGVIATVKTKEVAADRETLEKLDYSLFTKFNKVFGNYSFAAFFTAVSAILLSIPLLIGDYPYYNVVISLDSYLRLALPVALLLILVFLYCKNPISQRITGVKMPRSDKKYKLWCDLFGILPFVLIVIADAVFKASFAIYNDTANLVLDIIAIALLVSELVAGILLIIKYKRYGAVAVLTVIRNWLMVIPANIIITGMGIFHLSDGVSYLNVSYYNIFDAAVAGLAIFVVFGITEKLISKKFISEEPDKVNYAAMEAAEKGEISESFDNVDDLVNKSEK